MAQLRHIEIEGYRSIRKLRLELKALNVLIGANGSGKSNLIGALGLLGDVVDGRLQLHVAEQGGASARLHFGPKKTKGLRLCARFGPREYEVQLVHVAGDAFVFAKEQSAFHPDDESGSRIVTLFGDPGDKESGLDVFGPSEPAWHVIIVATQSVTLLDQFAWEDVIVVERSNGESIFRRVTEDELKSWSDDYSLGDLWLKNVLGGQPA